MTLILIALTLDHIVQVSDRRFVWLNASEQIVRTEDSHIKAVVTPRFARSYTGLAELGNGDTADWIATELSSHIKDHDAGVSALTAAARQEVNKQKTQKRPLAIVTAGWVHMKSGGTEARAIVISNFAEDTRGTPDDFVTRVISLKKERQSLVYPKGQPFYVSEIKGVNRDIENLCKRGRATARAIATVLTEYVRSVARSSGRKDYVSEEVLISSLPRLDRLKGHLVVGKLVEDYWSVTCIKSGEVAEGHGGPIIVGDKAAIQALPPEDRPPGGGVFVGARIVRMPESDGAIRLYVLTNPPLGQAWGWPGEGSP